MGAIMIGFILIVVLSGGLWWFFAILYPVYFYAKHQQRPSKLSTFLLSLGLAPIGYTQMLSLQPSEIALFIFSPPIAISIAATYAFSLHFFAAIFSAIFIFASHIFVINYFRNFSRLAISIFSAILLFLVPLIAENYSSNRKIISAFEAAGGDCLKAKSFYSSLQSFTRFGVEAHAAMYVGDNIFYWSYSAQQFLSPNEIGHGNTSLAPNVPCFP